MGTIFSRVKLSGKHVAALLALMLLSAVTAMLLPTALASMIDIGVAGENRNTILIIAAVMATLAILRLCVYYIRAIHSKVSSNVDAMNESNLPLYILFFVIAMHSISITLIYRVLRPAE